MDPRPSGSGQRGPCSPLARLQAGGRADFRVTQNQAAGRGLIRSSWASTQAPRIDSRLGLWTGWRLGPEESVRAARSAATRAHTQPNFLPPGGLGK